MLFKKGFCLFFALKRNQLVPHWSIDVASNHVKSASAINAFAWIIIAHQDTNNILRGRIQWRLVKLPTWKIPCFVNLKNNFFASFLVIWAFHCFGMCALIGWWSFIMSIRTNSNFICFEELVYFIQYLFYILAHLGYL